MSDFLPTFAELSGGKLPRGPKLDGHSFAGLLGGPGGHNRTWAYAERGKLFWVRTRDWKLYSNGRLFHVGKDPGEKSPLKITGLTTSQASVVKQLESAVRGIGPLKP